MFFGANFSRFEKDIISSYEKISGEKLINDQESYNQLNFEGNNLRERVNSLNKILFSLIDSYYFNNQNKDIHLVQSKNENTHKNFYFLAHNDHKGEPESVSFKDADNWSGILINSIKKVVSTQQDPIFVNDYELNDFELKIIKDLKKNEPLYKILFEEDPIKQKMHLNERYIYQITFIDTTHSKMNFETLSKFHKIEEYKLNSFLGEDNLKHYYYDKENDTTEDKVSELRLEEHLKKNYGIEYVNFKNSSNGWFIAHNKFEIVGLATVDKFINDFDMSDKMKYINYISVSEHFRGDGLGLRIFETILKEGVKNDWIIERSHPSANGKIYLKHRIDEIVDESDIPIINYNDSTSKISEVLKYIFKNKTETINLNNSELKIIFPDYKNARILLKKLLTQINVHILERDINLKEFKTENFAMEFEANEKMYKKIDNTITDFISQNIKTEKILTKTKKYKNQ